MINILLSIYLLSFIRILCSVITFVIILQNEFFVNTCHQAIFFFRTATTITPPTTPHAVAIIATTPASGIGHVCGIVAVSSTSPHTVHFSSFCASSESSCFFRYDPWRRRRVRSLLLFPRRNPRRRYTHTLCNHLRYTSRLSCR